MANGENYKKHGKTMVKWEYHRETWGSSWEFIADLQLIYGTLVPIKSKFTLVFIGDIGDRSILFYT